MKRKHERKDLQSVIELAREPRRVDQVNRLLPQGVSSPTYLCSTFESFEEADLKVVDDVQADGAEGELESHIKEEPVYDTKAAPSDDSISESSDPVKLYLMEMAKFQLLSREQ
jgi:hypothetical protein